MRIRVRYAPSPTGFQHVGGLRTALFNYLFARAQGGVFYLRLEDTDRSRYNPDAEKDLYESLAWAGIQWDEGPDKGGPFGPYVQSQRLDMYREAADRLVAEGKAYRCFCTSERLEALRKEQEANKLPSGYDRHCRNLSKDESNRRAASGEAHVVRFAMPLEGSVSITDQLLGPMEFKCAELPTDPVLLKSDGFPTYHLAHVVDDHAMQTSHVIRSQEWVASLGLHALLFKALGWEPPIYLHLPLVMGADGQKLSKRHGATAVKQFQEAGYLPEALVNGLALLGWSLDDSTEFFTLKELEKNFSLERLNKSAAVLDYKKLEHFNSLHLRALSDAELERRLSDVLLKSKPELSMDLVSKALARLLPHLKDRVVFLPDVIGLTAFIWEAPSQLPMGDLIPKKQTAEGTVGLLNTVSSLIADMETEPDEALEERFRAYATENGIKLGELMMPLRIAVTGSKVSLPLFPSLKVLGLAETRRRLETAQSLLKQHKE